MRSIVVGIIVVVVAVLGSAGVWLNLELRSELRDARRAAVEAVAELEEREDGWRARLADATRQVEILERRSIVPADCLLAMRLSVRAYNTLVDAEAAYDRRDYVNGDVLFSRLTSALLPRWEEAETRCEAL